MDKLRREIVRKHKNAGETQVPDVIVLGYDDLAFPFLALLTGICVAFIQLGIETVKKCIGTIQNDDKIASPRYSSMTNK